VQLWQALRGAYGDEMIGGLADVARLLAGVEGEALEALPTDAVRLARQLGDSGSPGDVVSALTERFTDSVRRAGSDQVTSPRIVDAVGHKTEVLMDGGIRSGQDLLKALALGAKGAMIGRIMAYGLGAGGEAGVTRALEIVRKETDTTMALMGERDIRNVGPHNIFSNELERRQGY
jgi:L-lactate dehydrogenase (cytochrome)